jgi:hypothetical protein
METGIDYGLGQTNIDHDNGIRYGVCPVSLVLQSWVDSAEPEYGLPACPNCCGEVSETFPENGSAENCKDYYCSECDYSFWSDVAYPEEPLSYVLENEGYMAESDDYGDIFIVKSPYYTFRGFCSPCAPGACHLETGGYIKCYCFGPDFFDDDNPCPYSVYRVVDNVCIYNPKET